MLPRLGKPYIYENGNIMGFISVNENSETEDMKYKVIMEIYKADDLNRSTTVMIYTNDINEAYAVMNSAA